MSAVTITGAHEPSPASGRRRAEGSGGGQPGLPPLAMAGLAAVSLAALSLLLPSTPTYDPWAWIVWG
ncbi:MAG TPA: hypothetical protein VE528_05655, partial [Thermoleophilaceae bacterium]|nr:hypothetical protein [Thermoleophilaceae bacterium]